MYYIQRNKCLIHRNIMWLSGIFHWLFVIYRRFNEIFLRFKEILVWFNRIYDWFNEINDWFIEINVRFIEIYCDSVKYSIHPKIYSFDLSKFSDSVKYLVFLCQQNIRTAFKTIQFTRLEQVIQPIITQAIITSHSIILMINFKVPYVKVDKSATVIHIVPTPYWDDSLT